MNIDLILDLLLQSHLWKPTTHNNNSINGSTFASLLQIRLHHVIGVLSTVLIILLRIVPP